MKVKNKKEIRLLNFREANAITKLDISPDSIPTLVPEAVMNKWLEGIDKPYYKIQQIEVPIKANGIIYEKSFFESFIGKLKDRPIPGSKSGHEMFYGKRPPTDLLLIGGKVDGNKVFFKNFVPPTGESGDNSVFIRENESDMVHYSLVAYTKEEIEETPDGVIIKVVESMFGERNDAVEWGTGAMQQLTNSMNLENPVVDGEENINRGNNTMDKEELLKKINSMRKNGDITLAEVAEAMELEGQIVTEEHQNALKVANAFKELKVEDPIAAYKTLQTQATKDIEAVRNAKITEAFGAPDPDKDGTEQNLVRAYANKMIVGDDIEKEVNAIKEDPIAMNLASQAADPASSTNRVEKKTNTNTEGSGPTVVDY